MFKWFSLCLIQPYMISFGLGLKYFNEVDCMVCSDLFKLRDYDWVLRDGT